MEDRQFLIVDADDTLWENNIYFERAFDDFIGFLDHSTLTAPMAQLSWNSPRAADGRCS